MLFIRGRRATIYFGRGWLANPNDMAPIAFDNSAQFESSNLHADSATMFLSVFLLGTIILSAVVCACCSGKKGHKGEPNMQDSKPDPPPPPVGGDDTPMIVYECLMEQAKDRAAAKVDQGSSDLT